MHLNERHVLKGSLKATMGVCVAVVEWEQGIVSQGVGRDCILRWFKNRCVFRWLRFSNESLGIQGSVCVYDDLCVCVFVCVHTHGYDLILC